MVKHMNETEFDQIKTRIKELAAMNAVDNAARIERISIEEALLDSPYKAHLYTEQMFDHLVFLELRELNTKLDKFLAHLPQLPNTTLNFPGDVEIIEQAPGECYEKDPASILHGDGGAGPGTTPRKSTTRRKR